MAIGRRRGGSRTSGGGAPRRRPREPIVAARAVRLRWMALGAVVALGVGGLVVALVAAGAGGGPDEGAREAAATAFSDAVASALAPLGPSSGPDLLAAPAAFVAELAAAEDDAGVVRAASAGEGLLTLLGPARAGIEAIDVPALVRGRGLEEAFVVDLIQARVRILEALDLYRAAARLATEAALLEDPSLEVIVGTARDLAEQAAASYLEGHDLLVEAQIAAGTYAGPLVPGTDALG